MSEKGKQAIKVLQFMPGVSHKPIHLNDPSVIHPDEPWVSWARDGDISGGKKICEFINWPGSEAPKQEDNTITPDKDAKTTSDVHLKPEDVQSTPTAEKGAEEIQ